MENFDLWVWIGGNWVNLSLVIVGFWAIIQYNLQKRNELKSAATIVKMQIDSIEKIMEQLKNHYEAKNLSNAMLYTLPDILTSDNWSKYKHIMIRKLSATDMKELDKFYLSAHQLHTCTQDNLGLLRHMWAARTVSISTAIYESIKESKEEKEIADLIHKISQPDVAFVPDLALATLYNKILMFKELTGTITYQNLEKLSIKHK